MDEPRGSPLAGPPRQGQGRDGVDRLQLAIPHVGLLAQSRQVKDRRPARQQRRVGGRVAQIARHDAQARMIVAGQGARPPAEGDHGAPLRQQRRDQRSAKKTRRSRDQGLAPQRGTSTGTPWRIMGCTRCSTLPAWRTWRTRPSSWSR